MIYLFTLDCSVCNISKFNELSDFKNLTEIFYLNFFKTIQMFLREQRIYRVLHFKFKISVKNYKSTQKLQIESQILDSPYNELNLKIVTLCYRYYLLSYVYHTSFRLHIQLHIDCRGRKFENPVSVAY